MSEYSSKEVRRIVEVAVARERMRCVDLVLYGDYHEFPADPKLDEEQQARVMMAALINKVTTSQVPK